MEFKGNETAVKAKKKKQQECQEWPEPNCFMQNTLQILGRLETLNNKSSTKQILVCSTTSNF